MIVKVEKALKENNQPLRYAEPIASSMKETSDAKFEQTVLDVLYNYRLHNEDL